VGLVDSAEEALEDGGEDGGLGGEGHVQPPRERVRRRALAGARDADDGDDTARMAAAAAAGDALGDDGAGAAA
jgi:hypothetical protein